MCSKTDDATLNPTTEGAGPPAGTGLQPRLSSRQTELAEVIARVVEKVYVTGYHDAGTITDRSTALKSMGTWAAQQITPIAEKADPYNSDPAKSTYWREDYESWNDENSNLRRHLLWLAQRPGVTLDERRELAGRLRGTLAEGGVIMDSSEEAARDFTQIKGTLEKLEPLLSLLVETLDQRVSESVQQGAESPRRLPKGYTDQVDRLLSRIREHIQEFPELATLHRLREVR